jgi:hypothetical protein
LNRPLEGGCERPLNFEHLFLESTKLMLTLEQLILCPYGVPYIWTISTDAASHVAFIYVVPVRTDSMLYANANYLQVAVLEV